MSEEPGTEQDPYEFEAESSDVAKSGLLTILRSVTAVIADLPDNRYRFRIEIEEIPDE